MERRGEKKEIGSTGNDRVREEKWRSDCEGEKGEKKGLVDRAQKLRVNPLILSEATATANMVQRKDREMKQEGAGSGYNAVC